MSNTQLSLTNSSVQQAIEHMICPITICLPVDPVFAEDGRLYERAAIEGWLVKHQRSPYSNEKMGTKLLAAPQVKCMLRTMVESGKLTGDMVDVWKTKLRLEKTFRMANNGNARAMFFIGQSYAIGRHGLQKDLTKALEWYTKSHEAGYPTGTAALGAMYLHGNVVPKCHLRAATLITQAATAGSKCACFTLSAAFSRGSHGFPRDDMFAFEYFSKVAKASTCDLRQQFIDFTASWLTMNEPK